MVYKSRGCFPEVYRVSGEVWSGLSLCASVFCLAVFLHVLTVFSCWLLPGTQTAAAASGITECTPCCPGQERGSPFPSAIKQKSYTFPEGARHYGQKDQITLTTPFTYLWSWGRASNPEPWLPLNWERVKGCGGALGFKGPPGHSLREKGNGHSGPMYLDSVEEFYLFTFLLLLALGPTRVRKTTIHKACHLLTRTAKHQERPCGWHFFSCVTRVREGLFHNGMRAANG